MLNLPTIQVPLLSGLDGFVRVEGTEVRLEQIVADFEDGASAEEIVSRHCSLRLSDVYMVLSFYLRNRKDVEDYLSARQQADHSVQRVPNTAA
jgi:uncharacterized protein (DUF433 family)